VPMPMPRNRHFEILYVVHRIWVTPTAEPTAFPLKARRILKFRFLGVAHLREVF
jgi:hypothetical protein